MGRSVRLDVDGAGVGILTVDRPHVRNALDWAALDEFRMAVSEAANADLRALIVTGAGSSFISGGDLSEHRSHHTEADGRHISAVMGDALAMMENLPIPVIAAIEGHARGGGCEIAVACDVRVAAEDADFGFVQMRLGLITGWGGAARLQRLVGYGRAMELLLTGRVITAREALAIGLVERLTPPGKALPMALEMAREIAERPPDAVRAVKAILRAGLPPETPAMSLERTLFPPLWAGPAHLDAVEAFLSRRRDPSSSPKEADYADSGN